MYSERPRKERTTAGKIAVVIVSGFILWFIIAFIVEANKMASEPKAPPVPTTTYTSNLVSNSVIDPTALRVNFEVTNTGTVTAKPACHVYAGNSTGTYKGYGDFTANEPLNVAQTGKYTVDLTITNEGAAYVTEGSVTCK